MNNFTSKCIFFLIQSIPSILVNHSLTITDFGSMHLVNVYYLCYICSQSSYCAPDTGLNHSSNIHIWIWIWIHSIWKKYIMKKFSMAPIQKYTSHRYEKMCFVPNFRRISASRQSNKSKKITWIFFQSVYIYRWDRLQH